MKKRVLSLVMAFVLCLSMLPTAALAEEVRAAASKDAGREAVYTVDGDAAAPEGGIAPLRAEKNVVSVTINGETTEYSDIIEAFEETVNFKNVNATFKLLDNVELPNDESGFPGRIGFRSSGTSTLDLNGYTITHADTGYADFNTVSILDVGGGTLTITGKGTIHGMYNTAAVTVRGGTLTIDDGITVKGEFAYGGKEFYGSPVADKTCAIAAKGGTLIIKDDTFTATSGVALEYTKGTVRLYGGSFNGMNIATRDYFGAINEGVTVVDLLAPGYTYQHTDGSSLEDYYVQSVSDVKVVKGLTPVPYVDENGAGATATEYIQMEPDTTEWNGGLYVVRGNVTIDDDVTVTGTMPGIILCDRASLTVNGGITLPDGSAEPLTIYGQSGGTGKMAVTNNSGAAFSCGNLSVLRLLSGTLTAAGKDAACSNVTTWNQQNGNDEIKCIATGSDPEVWADGQNVPSVTLSRCTEHQWGYAQHASAEQHLKTCKLCGYNPNGAGVYANCEYDTYFGQDESGHKQACVCHRTAPGAALTAHTPTYSPNADGATHTYRCTDCGFVSGKTEGHRYTDGVCSVCGYDCPHESVDAEIGSETEGVCRVCGKRIYVARLVVNEGTSYKTVEYTETVREALERYENGGPIVTLLCDVDMGTGALVVTSDVTGKLLDLNGHTLSGSGDTVFQIYKEYGFTVRDGTIENTGSGDAIQLIRVKAGIWGYSDGNLTLENVNATAATGWAVKAAYKENDTEGEVNPGNGELYIRSGTYKGGLNGGALRTIQISGGTFIANPDTHSIMNPGPVTGPSALQKYLAPEHTYADAGGNAINYFASGNHTLGDKKNSLGYRMDIWLNADTVTITEHTSHVIDRESGKCTICGAPCPHVELNEAGFCTACGGRVMFCEVEGTLYPTIYKALEAVTNRTDNPVIKLLDNYTSHVTNIGTASGCTLDLNGFQISTSQVIIYKDHVLTIIDSSEKKTGSMGALWVDGGHVTIQDGSYAELIASYADSIKITGEGTVKVRKIRMLGDYSGSNKKVVADLLEPGYAVYLVDETTGTKELVNGYYNLYNNGNLQQYLPGPYKESNNHLKDGQYYTVAAHDHDFADSTQTTCACGKTCTHDSVDAGGKCAGCGMTFTAKVTDGDGNTVYYADGAYDNGNSRSGLDFALEAASSGSTVTVLGGSSVTGYLDGGKALTLNLNGKNVRHLYVGRSSGVNSLAVTGAGDIDSLYVHKDNVADLTGWAGKMELLYVYDGGKATLAGGTFDKVTLGGNTAGSLLASGHAFRYEDGSYVAYDATDNLTKTVSVVTCGYEGWYGSDSSAVCPYCGQTGAIQVPVTVDGTAQDGFYLTLQAAIGEKNRDTAKAITLLRNISGGCTIDSDVSLDTKGFRIDGTLTVKNATVSFSGRGSTVTAVTMSGSEAKFELIERRSVLPEIGTLTITDGADWRSILPTRSDRHGYKLRKVGGGYEWKDSDTADANVSSMTNVCIARLPIPDPTLRIKVNGKDTIGAEINTPVQLVANCGTGAAPTVTFYLQKNGSETIVRLTDATASGVSYVSTYAFPEDGRYTVWFEATRDGYTARSSKSTLNISKPHIPTEVITMPQAKTDLVYNGTEQELLTPGVLDPKYGTFLYGALSDYSTAIPKARNAGTYLFGCKILCSDNYAGVEHFPLMEITIAKRMLTVQDVVITPKTYDGTDEAVCGAVTFGNALDHETPGYHVSGVYSDSSAGGGKTIQITVELRGNAHQNYVLDNGGSGASSITFLKTGLSIAKAAAPAAVAGALTILNNVDGTYTFDLSDLLPAAPKGEYGTVTYGNPQTDLGVGTFVTRVNSETGAMTLEVSNRSGGTEGPIGTITVDVTTDNYETIPLTVNVSAQNRPVPAPDGAVTASGITYGQTLDESVLTGTMKAGDTTVPGTFTWQYPNAVLNAGTCPARRWTTP